MFDIQDLECGYPRAPQTLKITSFNVRPGSIVFLLGPNGAGKTTLLKTLAGILPPRAGALKYFGAQLDFQRPLKDRPAYGPAKPQIQPGVTGYDLFDLFDSHGSRFALGSDTKSIADEFETEPLMEIPLQRLSSGEFQRVFLTALLSHPSEVVLLDEPFSHLDWRHSFILHYVLKKQIHLGRSFVISLHDFNLALSIGNFPTLVLNKSEIVIEQNLFEAIIHPKVQEIFGFQSCLVSNPLDGGKLLATKHYDKH